MKNLGKINQQKYNNFILKYKEKYRIFSGLRTKWTKIFCNGTTVNWTPEVSALCGKVDMAENDAHEAREMLSNFMRKNRVKS